MKVAAVLPGISQSVALTIAENTQKVPTIFGHVSSNFLKHSFNLRDENLLKIRTFSQVPRVLNFERVSNFLNLFRTGYNFRLTFSTRSKIFTGARGAFFRFRLQTQRTDVKPVLNTYFSRRSYASSGFLGSNSFAFLLYPLGNPLQRVHWGTTGVGLVLLNGPTLSPRCLEQTTFDIPRPSLEQTKH